MFRPLINMYERRTIFRTYLYSFQSRRERRFFEICSIFALWIFSFFVFDTSVVGQDLVPNIITSDLNSDVIVSNYPLYFCPNLQSSYSDLGYNLNDIHFYNLRNDSSVSNWSSNVQKQFWRAFTEYIGTSYCLLSDIVSMYRYKYGITTAFTSQNELLIEVPNSLQPGLTYFFSTSTRNFNKAFFICGINGVVYYRLTPLEGVYDVFFYLYLIPQAFNSPNFTPRSNAISFVEMSNEGNDSFVAGHEVATFGANMKTYQFCGSFRLEIDGSSYEIFQDDDSYSLPFIIQGNTIGFTQTKNYYWTSYGTSEKGSIDYPIFSSYNFNSSRNNTSVWPYYQELRFETVNQSFLLSGVDFPDLQTLDTDNGGMTDFHEWYQTKHVLTNPADDTDDTEEIEPEPLPEPEEGEEVVDIGKDTQERYGAYWDEKTGDDEELPELNPPDFQDLPSPAPRDFYFDQVTSPIEQAFQNEMRDNKFKQNFDQTFDNFTANDAEFSWVINPSVNSSLVQMPLPSISIAPKTWIQDPVYGPYFRTFRACLLLVEFLFFMYKMYKLAVASLSGGPISADTGGDDDD